MFSLSENSLDTHTIQEVAEGLTWVGEESCNEFYACIYLLVACISKQD